MNFVSYFFSDKIALAMYARSRSRASNCRAPTPQSNASHRKIGIPMPKIYVIPTESPNAFATGRNPQHASVAVTHGILSLLTDEELEGVLAHELGHVSNRDILISSVAAHCGSHQHAGQHGALGNDLRRLRPQRARRPRRRRHKCARYDHRRAHRRQPDSARRFALARIPGRRHRRAHHRQSYALASALQKLDAYSRRVPMQASPSTAHLFIIQPFLGMNFGSLFSTHPPIAKRIERLTGRPAEFMQ